MIYIPGENNELMVGKPYYKTIQMSNVFLIIQFCIKKLIAINILSLISH